MNRYETHVINHVICFVSLKNAVWVYVNSLFESSPPEHSYDIQCDSWHHTSSAVVLLLGVYLVVIVTVVQ